MTPEVAGRIVTTMLPLLEAHRQGQAEANRSGKIVKVSVPGGHLCVAPDEASAELLAAAERARLGIPDPGDPDVILLGARGGR